MNDFQPDASFDGSPGSDDVGFTGAMAAIDQLMAGVRETSGGEAGAELRHHIRALRVRVGRLEDQYVRLETAFLKRS
jgi:hypothetical protein